jgi:UDP:flavonoid glycosyltransferase YjiC (YdhE family)
VRHGLGIAADVTRADAADLAALIRRAAGDPSLRRRVAAMREEFLRTNDTALAASIVERTMTRSALPSAGAAGAASRAPHPLPAPR